MYTNPSKSLLKVITYIFRSVLSIIYGFYLMNRKVLLSYRDVWSHSLNLKFTGATYRAGIDYLSGAHGFTVSFKWGSCCLICRFPCSVLYIIVCPFIRFLLVIYGFWLYLLVSSNLSSKVKIPCTSNRVSLVLWYWQFRRQWNWRRYCLKYSEADIRTSTVCIFNVQISIKLKHYKKKNNNKKRKKTSPRITDH